MQPLLQSFEHMSITEDTQILIHPEVPHVLFPPLSVLTSEYSVTPGEGSSHMVLPTTPALPLSGCRPTRKQAVPLSMHGFPSWQVAKMAVREGTQLSLGGASQLRAQCENVCPGIRVLQGSAGLEPVTWAR